MKHNMPIQYAVLQLKLLVNLQGGSCLLTHWNAVHLPAQ